MAVKTLYFKNVTVNGALSLQDGGTAPTAALTTTGWVVAKNTTPNFALMAVGTKPTAFSTTDALATPSLKAASCWRSENTFDGTFANTNWSLVFHVRCTTQANASGCVKCRIWKSSTPDGSSGNTELTSAVLTGTTTGSIVTNTSGVSTVTFTPGAPITLANEYLFVQCEWSIVVASGNASGDVAFYVESTSAITTPNFVPTQRATAGLVSDADASYAPSSAALNDLLPPSYALDDVFRAVTATGWIWAYPALDVDVDAALAPVSLNTNTVQPLDYDDSQSGVAKTYPPDVEAWAWALPDEFADTELIGAPTAIPGGVTLVAKLHLSDELIGPFDLLSIIYTSGAYDDDTDSIFVPEGKLWTQLVDPSLLADHERVEVCHGMGVTAQGFLLPFDAVADDVEMAYGAVVEPGAVGLQPSASDALDLDQVLAAQSDASSQLGAAKWTADGAEQVYAPALEPGDAGVAASGFSDVDTVAAAQLVAGAVPGQPDDVLSDDDTHHGFAVDIGEVQIGAFPYGDADDVFACQVKPANISIIDARIFDHETFFSPVLTGGAQAAIYRPPPLKGSIGDPAYMVGRVGRAPPPLTGSIGRAA